ncbi:MAG: acyltransferase [Desulfobacterales bacterium]|nr:acyltransferase [Desulfobacterales bacterium]
MRKDHRPYYLKRFYQKFEKFYAHHFIKPQFEFFGRGVTFIKPWHVEVFGSPVKLGSLSTVIAASDKKVRFCIWSNKTDIKGISIGDYCLICPGVRISAASEIIINESCMIASGAYLTDSDWHGIYDRSFPVGNTKPVILEKNVWVGDSSIICKGITIGENSIIGAGSVVVNDIPANCIAAGNPAKVVKELDKSIELKTRANWLEDPSSLSRQFRELDRENLKGNTLLGWIRSIFFPKQSD